MSIYDDVSTGMKEAMKAKQTDRLTALRGIRAAFLHEMKKDNSESLADEACLGLLRRLEKQRKESIDAFEAAGRAEQAAAEKAELAIIQEFLPQLADEETTRGWVAEAIEQTGASGPAELGKVMGAIMKGHKADVDGNVARKIAAELLGG